MLSLSRSLSLSLARLSQCKTWSYLRLLQLEIGSPRKKQVPRRAISWPSPEQCPTALLLWTIKWKVGYNSKTEQSERVNHPSPLYIGLVRLPIEVHPQSCTARRFGVASVLKYQPQPGLALGSAAAQSCICPSWLCAFKHDAHNIDSDRCRGLHTTPLSTHSPREAPPPFAAGGDAITPCKSKNE